MSLSSASNPIILRLNIGDQLTSISCGHIVVELVKFIAYQRQQIPYAYPWLKQVVNKKKSKDDVNNDYKESFQSERHFHVASTALENLDFILKSLLQEINGASLPNEVCIALGGTTFTLKEVYRLILPTTCHKPQCQSTQIATDQKIQQNVFRSLIEKLTQVFYTQMTPTNMYVFLRKKCVGIPDITNCENFQQTSGCRIPKAGEIPVMPIYLAGLIMCGGFFMMYLIEELVHLYINSRATKPEDTNPTRPFGLRKSITEEPDVPSVSKHVDSTGHSHLVIDDDSVVSALRGLLIVLALSVHELFEGLAVGLESSVVNVWYMFAAVSAHKYIIAFCIGVELLAAGTKKWLSLIYIFTFSFMSALGIGIGILLVGGAGAAEAGLYSVILQGLACGTLVYVVFFEVWRRSSGLLQFVCSLLGFAVMLSLEVGVELAV